jgi:outer membrane protein, heavy metal efflux system
MPRRRSAPCRPGRRILFGVCVLPLLCGGAAAEGASNGALTLEVATERALAANPTIAAARMQGAVDAAALAVARERVNPEAAVEVENEAPKQSLALALPFELGGKRAKRIAVSEFELAAGEARLVATIAEVRNAVRRAYFGVQVAEARLELLGEMRDIAGRVRDSAEERFEAGDAARLEVMQAELALASAENEATATDGEAGVARAELNALLGQPLDGELNLSSPIDGGPPPTTSEALDLARAASARLRVLDRSIDAQGARVTLARALRIPDVVPSATLTHDAQPDFEYGWRAGLAFALPLFTTHRAGVLMEQATLDRLRAERRALWSEIEVEVTAAATLVETRRQLYLRYRDDIVPQAQEVEQLAEASYQLGQTGIAALLQALQASQDIRLRSIDSGAQYQGALADLESATGSSLP